MASWWYPGKGDGKKKMISENTMMAAVEIDEKMMEFTMASGGRRYVLEEVEDAIVELERKKVTQNEK
ncbi:hypothetical protein L1887_13761 [Cichorium endivia]|nr:hypothetical protein L1887_13761 [Cichorium endivia]